MPRTTAGTATNSITAPGLILGIGFGGLFDGIVLHQILQWHHMLSSRGCCPVKTVHGLQLNILADGLFHLATIVLLLIATTMLWRRVHEDGVPWSGWQLFGLGLEGWGLFNLIEGLVDHQMLGLHHVHPPPHQFEYDMGFLAFGVVLLVGGNFLARTHAPDRSTIAGPSPSTRLAPNPPGRSRARHTVGRLGRRGLWSTGWAAGRRRSSHRHNHRSVIDLKGPEGVASRHVEG